MKLACCVMLMMTGAAAAQTPWKKHVIYQGGRNHTVIAADFTGDGRIDVITAVGKQTILLPAPDFKPLVIAATPPGVFHSEAFDVDGDGDTDYIASTYSPGRLYWLQRPTDPLNTPWTYHVIDEQINGIHGVLAGDVNGDGRTDLLANSAQPDKTPFPHSAAWYELRPFGQQPRFERHIFAAGDAPGLTHYLGLGDVTGDAKPDIAMGAKGHPAPAGAGDYFAYWQHPADPRGPWTRRTIATQQPGATNIHPADVDADGKVDFIASRGHGKGVLWFQAPDFKPRTIHETLDGPHCLAVADLDADGDIDAATCTIGDKTAAWFENDGRGNFTTHILDHDQAAYDIRAVDLDADGDLDLLISGQASANVVWYENPLRSTARP